MTIRRVKSKVSPLKLPIVKDDDTQFSVDPFSKTLTVNHKFKLADIS
jgi:hypothetical protein